MRYLFAFLLSIALGFPARAVGRRFHLTGRSSVPATGGFALAASWAIAWFLWGPLASRRVLLGLALAMIPLFAVSLLDLRRPLGPTAQFFGQALAAAMAVVFGGIAIPYVTHPFGGLLLLNHWTVWSVPALGGLFTIFWMMILMNAVNFLDGADGVAAVVSGLGYVTIGVVSLLPQVAQPAIAIPAFLAAAATAGFLFWNIPPASLYLGTPGAWFLGFLLAVLSVQGSSKIATLAVVGAIPLLDAGVVILRRVQRGASPFHGDRGHLHDLLRSRGWSARRILGLYAGGSLLLALCAVLLPTAWKIVLFSSATMLVLASAFFFRQSSIDRSRGTRYDTAHE